MLRRASTLISFSLLLFPRNQKSECQDQYKGLPVVEMKQPDRGPKPFQLRQHDSNGPSKVRSYVLREHFYMHLRCIIILILFIIRKQPCGYSVNRMKVYIKRNV